MKRQTDRIVLSSCWEQLRTGKWQRLSLALLVAVMTMTAQTAWADVGDIIYVSSTGDNVNDGKTKDTPLATISAAVSAATGGETIFIKNGEYTETAISIGSKQLTFIGESQDGVIIKSGNNNLFYTTESGYESIVISNLTFKDISMTDGNAPIFIGGDGDVTIENCTFDNCESRYGAMRIFTSGSATIDNCTFLNTKSSNRSYSSAIDFGGSSDSDYTITNTVIDGSSISSTNTASIYGAIYNEKTGGIVILDNDTIRNCSLNKANGLITTKGDMSIKNSTFVDNDVHGDLSTAGFIFVNGSKTVTIESSLIQGNTQPNYFLSSNNISASFDLNYNNIQNNTFNTAFTNPNNGSYSLEANYWGSNVLPAGITATTWVVENNGEYTLNTGGALAKDIPGLTGGEEPVVIPEVTIYVSATGSNENDGSTQDAPTTLQNALEITPEGGSIFLCDGEYVIDELYISKSVKLVGESRDGVILTGDGGGFIIEDLGDSDDFVSFSKMTIESSFSDFIYVPASVTDLTITDCVLSLTGLTDRFLRVGDDVEATGTLNFKKNIIISDDVVIAVGGQWDANINDNIFLNSNSGETAVIIEDGVGDIDVDYNYWGSNDPATTLEYNDLIIATASSDATEIFIDESAEITVAMTLGDGTNANGHLPVYPIVATLSAGGTLSQVELALVEGAGSVSYSSDVARNDNIQIEILGQTLTVPITVKERYLGIIYVDTNGSDDNEGSENAPVATVGKAVELALVDGGSHEIIINEGTYVGNGYHVTGDLTVTGNGKVTLDANNKGRLFYMEYGDAANKIELKNLILTNAIGYGAAVNSFADELILENDTIVKNYANGYLIKSYGKLTIKDSEISESKSGNVIQQDAPGDIFIKNTVFANDTIHDTTSVMAVVNINSGSGNMVIEDSKFIKNTARQGVIKGNYFYNIKVTGTEFTDNTNELAYGGAIYIGGGNLDITNCVFNGNKADRSGGAIYVGYRVTATVDSCIFIGNTANTMGGDYYGDAIYNGNKLTVTNSAFLGDAANYMIYNDGEDNVVTAQNCWWGTNEDPSSMNGVGYYEDDNWEEWDCPPVDVSNWVTMSAAFTPADAQAGEEVTVTATFSNDKLPDGIPVKFASTSGNLDADVSTTVGAIASTTYTIDASDEAITATSGNVTIEMPIVNRTVTQDNFYSFFDESGYIREDVTFDELIFQGEFSELAEGYVIIDKPVTITGDNAVLNDMGIVIYSKDVAIDNLTLNATTSLGDLIYVGASHVDLTNLNITYVVDDEGANVINVVGDVAGDEENRITNVSIKNNTIYFESHATSDEELVTAINLDNVKDVIVDGNTITADYPGLSVKTYDYDYLMMGLVYVNPVRVYKSNDVELTNNNIDVTVNSYSASYPTVQALSIVACNGVLVQGNNFTMVDDITPAGNAIYLYAVQCGFSDGIEFIENNLDISTNGGQSDMGSVYAFGVATSEATFIGNNITCESNCANVGISSPCGFGQAKSLIIKDNLINITGLATRSNEFALISGIEIQTGYATIKNNTIYVQNKGGYDDSYPVSGVSAIQYSASTLSFDIQDNEILVPDGKYAVEMLYAPSKATVTGNILCAHELISDAAVNIAGDNNTVRNNHLTAKEVTVDEQTDYWTTFYCGVSGLTFNDATNACAYTATVSGTTITLHKLGRVIPTGTAVIIVSEDEYIDLKISTAEAENTVGNNLHGVDMPTALSKVKKSLDADAILVLSNKGGNFGFHELATTNVPARKAFLAINDPSGAREFTMVFEDATGIKSIDHETFLDEPSGKAERNIDHSAYDLQGRRVSQPTKGLYIVNGKKVVIK